MPGPVISGHAKVEDDCKACHDPHSDPPVALKACADCHSNETVWPWYSNIAPVSWLVETQVHEGRAALEGTMLGPSIFSGRVAGGL